MANVIVILDGKIVELTAEQSEAVRAICCGVITTAEPKKTSPKGKSKKSSSGFDRKRYEDIALKCGVLGRHGVWKGCRSVIYAVMDGEKSLAEAKRECAAFAKEHGWSLVR